MGVRRADRTNWKLTAWLLPAVIATLLMAGCTGPDTKGSRETTEPGSADPATEAAPVGDAPEAQEVTILGDDTPLGGYRQYLEGPDYDYDKWLQAAIEATDKREALVASCMKDAGFEYYPVPWGGETKKKPHPGFARSAYLMVPVLDPDRDIVPKWGYGLDPENQSTGPFPDQNPEFEETVTKNQQYAESLNAKGQEQYQLTLFGPTDPQTGQPLDGSDGCAGRAMAQSPQVDRPKANDDFSTAYNQLRIQFVRVTTWDVGMDPRSVALDEKWAKCAVGKGLDMSDKVFERTDGRPTSDVSMKNRVSPGSAFDKARTLNEDGESIFAGLKLDDPVPEGLEPAMRAYPAQVEIALIDYDCRKELGYMDRVMEIQIDVEQQFLDKNRTALEAMKNDATRQ
jgi:hypothetical protein